MDVRFVDTTFRDGSQSLWASGMRMGMVEAVAEAMDQAGFEAIEVPLLGIYFKKFVRDLKEDPWELARMVARKMPNTVKGCMAGGAIHPFEAPPPRSIIKLFYTRVVEIGALNRAQLTLQYVWPNQGRVSLGHPAVQGIGPADRAGAVLHHFSAPHRRVLRAKDARDPPVQAGYDLPQGPGRATHRRSPADLASDIVQNANGVPVELHSHCTTGLAPLVYLEALKLGVRTLHTAVPPLANGSSQPSVFNVASNARHPGIFTPGR